MAWAQLKYWSVAGRSNLDLVCDSDMKLLVCYLVMLLVFLYLGCSVLIGIMDKESLLVFLFRTLPHFSSRERKTPQSWNRKHLGILLNSAVKLESGVHQLLFSCWWRHRRCPYSYCMPAAQHSACLMVAAILAKKQFHKVKTEETRQLNAPWVTGMSLRALLCRIAFGQMVKLKYALFHYKGWYYTDYKFLSHYTFSLVMSENAIVAEPT